MSIFDRTDVFHLWTGSPVSTDGKISMSFFYAKKKNLVRNDPFCKVSVYNSHLKILILAKKDHSSGDESDKFVTR